jgi:hypothetical protein
VPCRTIDRTGVRLIFRKTMIVLATTAVLSGGLTANAVALGPKLPCFPVEFVLRVRWTSLSQPTFDGALDAIPLATFQDDLLPIAKERILTPWLGVLGELQSKMQRFESRRPSRRVRSLRVNKASSRWSPRTARSMSAYAAR